MDVHHVEANPQGGKPHIIPSLRCDLILGQKIETEHIKSPLFWELNLFRQFRRSSVFVWQRLVIKKGWWLRVQTWQMLLPKGSWNVRRTIDTV